MRGGPAPFRKLKNPTLADNGHRFSPSGEQVYSEIPGNCYRYSQENRDPVIKAEKAAVSVCSQTTAPLTNPFNTIGNCERFLNLKPAYSLP